MKIKEAVIKTRSYRAFDESERIGEERLLSYIDTARLTASTANKQALSYRVVHTPEECEKTLATTKWAGLLKDEKLPPEGKAPTGYIIICVNGRIHKTGNSTVYYKDTGIVAQTIMLSATEDGFGGCMIGSFDEDELVEALDIPCYYEPTLVLALGKPAETVELIEMQHGESAYFRKNGVHYVPKRSLKKVLI